MTKQYIWTGRDVVLTQSSGERVVIKDASLYETSPGNYMLRGDRLKLKSTDAPTPFSKMMDDVHAPELGSILAGLRKSLEIAITGKSQSKEAYAISANGYHPAFSNLTVCGDSLLKASQAKPVKAALLMMLNDFRPLNKLCQYPQGKYYLGNKEVATYPLNEKAMGNLEFSGVEDEFTNLIG